MTFCGLGAMQASSTITMLAGRFFVAGTDTDPCKRQVKGFLWRYSAVGDLMPSYGTGRERRFDLPVR